MYVCMYMTCGSLLVYIISVCVCVSAILTSCVCVCKRYIYYIPTKSVVYCVFCFFVILNFYRSVFAKVPSNHLFWGYAYMQYICTTYISTVYIHIYICILYISKQAFALLGEKVYKIVALGCYIKMADKVLQKIKKNIRRNIEKLKKNLQKN